MLEKSFLDFWFEVETGFTKNLKILKSRMEADIRKSELEIARARQKSLQAITVVDGSKKMAESINWKKVDSGGL